MKQLTIIFSVFVTLICNNIYSYGNSYKITESENIFIKDQLGFVNSVSVDTIAFEDMNYEYTIIQYKVDGTIVQMNIDRKGSATDIDYILWDMDKNGRMEAIGVYNVLEQKYDYYLIEEDLAAGDLLEFQVQLEDIGFPSFYNSSDVPKAVYKSNEHQPILNYFK